MIVFLSHCHINLHSRNLFKYKLQEAGIWGFVFACMSPSPGRVAWWEVGAWHLPVARMNSWLSGQTVSTGLSCLSPRIWNSKEPCPRAQGLVGGWPGIQSTGLTRSVPASVQTRGAVQRRGRAHHLFPLYRFHLSERMWCKLRRMTRIVVMEWGGIPGVGLTGFGARWGAQGWWPGLEGGNIVCIKKGR